MKTLLKWFVKKFVDKSVIKDAIHNANAALRENVATDDSAKKKVIDIGNDAANLIGSYLNAYVDDGKIDDAEEASVNEACDRLVDKYVTDEMVEAVIDRIFA